MESDCGEILGILLCFIENIPTYSSLVEAIDWDSNLRNRCFSSYIWNLMSLSHCFTSKQGQDFLTQGRSRWPMISASG